MILAFNAVAAVCSVALATRQGESVAQVTAPIERNLDQALWTLLPRIFEEAACTMAEVHTLITVVGPGSFTGIRAGLAAAQGFAFANPNLAVFGMRGFECQYFAAGLDKDGVPCLALISFGRDRFYGMEMGSSPLPPKIYALVDVVAFADNGGIILSDTQISALEEHSRSYRIVPPEALGAIRAFAQSGRTFPLVPLYVAPSYVEKA